MAIDGVKIIDSDDRYDIYNDVVEHYKDGVSVDKIISDRLVDEKIIVPMIFTQRFIGLLLPILYGK